MTPILTEQGRANLAISPGGCGRLPRVASPQVAQLMSASRATLPQDDSYTDGTLGGDRDPLDAKRDRVPGSGLFVVKGEEAARMKVPCMPARALRYGSCRHLRVCVLVPSWSGSDTSPVCEHGAGAAHSWSYAPTANVARTGDSRGRPTQGSDVSDFRTADSKWRHHQQMFSPETAAPRMSHETSASRRTPSGRSSLRPGCRPGCRP